MIKETGIINREMYDDVRKLFSKSPQLAGEFAYSLIELIITGESSCDDIAIQCLVDKYRDTIKKNEERYERRLKAKEKGRMSKLQLKEIAEGIKEGLTQNQIAERLNVTASCISKRIVILRADYPELLED